MIRTSPVPFLGECYADEARPFSSQDVCNWLPAPAEKGGTLSPEMGQTPPGLRPFVEVSGPNALRPVRGTHNCEGKLFSTIGNTLYQISNSGIAIPIGTVPGVTRVASAHNQVTNGNQLVVVNGSSGYVYDTSTQVYERITDDGYPGAITADFVDGYIVGIEPGRRFAFNSDLANAKAYNTLDRFTSEYRPDLLVTQVVSNNELILLSETSGEVFYNSGAAQQPFRTKRVFFDKGCSGRSNAKVIDNSFVFHANDGMFYLYDNGTPKRISTRPIEQAVRGLNWTQAFCEVWVDGGHSVAYWTFPGGHTWGWDASSGKWHRRESYGLDRWRMNTLTRWGDEWIAGDFQRGRLWVVDWDYFLEGDQEYESKITGVVISDSQNQLKMSRMEVLMDVGQEMTFAVPFPEQPEPPTISGTAPDGQIGTTYTGYGYTIAGTAPLVVTLRSGTLPPGLTISSAGVLSATSLTQAGSFTFTLRVTDGNGLYAEHTDTVLVAAVQFATQSSSLLRYTSDPYDWDTTVNVGAPVTGSLVESRNGKVFAFYTTDDGASVSNDAGATWTPCTGLPSIRITALVYADDTYIAVPASGTDIYVSSDGLAFSSRSYAPGSEVTSSAIAIDNVVIIGRSSPPRRSTDGGHTWADAGFTVSTQVWAIASSGESICAITAGVLPSIRRSINDGASWSTIGSPIGQGLASIAFGNGVYLLVNAVGEVATSPDGVTWTVKTSLPENMGGVGQGNEMVFDGQNFVVAAASHIYTSPDGVTWTQRTNIAATAIAFYRTGQ